jgi:hypothetical protein
VPLNASSEVPAASGQVTVGKADGQEQPLRVRVEHLAPPARLVPEATVYVVWLKPDGTDRPMNIGVLNLDDDLTGTLETRTPYKGFDVFVTPEASAAVTTPSNHQVMQAQVQTGDRAIR